MPDFLVSVGVVLIKLFCTDENKQNSYRIPFWLFLQEYASRKVSPITGLSSIMLIWIDKVPLLLIFSGFTAFLGLIFAVAYGIRRFRFRHWVDTGRYGNVSDVCLLKLNQYVLSGP